MARTRGQAGAAGVEPSVITQRSNSMVRRAIHIMSNDVMGPPPGVADLAIDLGDDVTDAAIDLVNDFRRARRLRQNAARRRNGDDRGERSSSDQCPKHEVLPAVSVPVTCQAFSIAFAAGPDFAGGHSHALDW
jgi:hypothetical protein